MFSFCERKSGRKSVTNRSKTEKELTVNKKEELKFTNCFCNNGLCDYCVLVIAITDGDTFKGLTKEKEEIRFRIYGIDAPEKKQAFGTKSKEYLSNLIFGEIVGVKVDSKDRYSRSIVWVFTSDGKDVSSEMLKAGMAWHYKKYDDSVIYSKLEIEARNSKNGLWREDTPIEPWNFRN